MIGLSISGAGTIEPATSRINRTNMDGFDRNSVAVVVDPISTGLQVTQYCQEAGIKCVALFSTTDSTAVEHYSVSLSKMSFEAQLSYEGDPESDTPGVKDPALMKIVGELQKLPYPIGAVFPGCETGVTLAERLATTLGVRSNGMGKLMERRDKFHMANAVAAAGLRSVRQVRPDTWEEVEKFVKEVNPSPFKIIMKPSNSAGSDGVVCCRSLEEVRARWEHIKSEKGVNLMGQPMDVLVQEFLEGTEYVVNAVSRDGVHKITCVWEYEKRRVNGGDFTYLASRLVPAPKRNEDSVFWRALIDYNNKMLDSLDIMNGASHAEIMVKELPAAPASRRPSLVTCLAGVTAVAAAAAAVHSRSNTVAMSSVAAAAATFSVTSMVSDAKKAAEPSPCFDICLVEVGSRCQGAEGSFIPISDRSIGYNQASITASAYLDGAEFNAIPLEPVMKKRGLLVWMVSYEEGKFLGLRGEERIKALPSFVDLKMVVHKGDHITKTSDVMSVPGCVTLVHECQEQVEKDVAVIRHMEENGLFMVEEVVMA